MDGAPRRPRREITEQQKQELIRRYQAREERRFKVVAITPGAIIDLLTAIQKNWIVRVSGLPEDAYLISVHYDHMRLCFIVLIASMSYSIVADGAVPPEEYVTINHYVRPAVGWFAQEMEQKLRKHDDDREGWQTAHPLELWGYMVDHLTKLSVALHHPDLDYQRVIQAAADVGNYAMMIADLMRINEGLANERDHSEDGEGVAERSPE